MLRNELYAQYFYLEFKLAKNNLNVNMYYLMLFTANIH